MEQFDIVGEMQAFMHLRGTSFINVFSKIRTM